MAYSFASSSATECFQKGDDCHLILVTKAMQNTISISTKPVTVHTSQGMI